CILSIGIVMCSCAPGTYSYYPSQRRISHQFDPRDSIYIIFPYANFSVIGDEERILDRDNERADLMAKLSNDHILEVISEKFGATPLKANDYDREALGAQFLKM